MRRMIALIFLGLSPALWAAVTGEEILARMDANTAFRTISYTGRMEITAGGVTRTKVMKAKAASDGKAIVEFTNAEDKGIKYLKLGSQMWIYYPSENDTVLISGHMLKEGMMGSDVSYEDALNEESLADQYSVDVSSAEASFQDRPCWQLTLTAKTDKAPYRTLTMLVDKETYVAWKEEMYAPSGKLLKESTVLEVQKIGTAYFAVKIRMDSKLVENHSTVFTMSDVVLNPAMDPSTFSTRFLSR